MIFTLGGMVFEYDEQKNQINIKKHGMPGIYHQYDGQMTDGELDQLLYGYQVVAV